MNIKSIKIIKQMILSLRNTTITKTNGNESLNDNMQSGQKYSEIIENYTELNH
jgi:NADH:ubiquinone oxidoreductase subunit D